MVFVCPALCLAELQHLQHALGQGVHIFLPCGAGERQHLRALGPEHQKAVGKAVREFTRSHQTQQLRRSHRADHGDMWISGPQPIAFGGWPHAHAVPTIAQCRRQRVALTLALMQHVGELALDHQQAFIEDGRNFFFALGVAIVDQVHQTLTTG